MFHRQPFGLLPLIIVVAPSFGQNLDAQQAALKEIRATAADICATPPLQGSSSTLELTGDAKAKLAGVVGKVADLGVEGAAKYNTQQYQGVLQQELASAIKNSNDCKLTVFNTLVQRMLPAPNGPNPQQDKASCLSQRDGAACDRYSVAVRYNCPRADRPCQLRATCWEDKSRAIVMVTSNCGPGKDPQGCDFFKNSSAALLTKDCDAAP